MTNKGASMTVFESECYGMAAAEINEQYMQSLTAQRCGLEMVVMGLLSDAQELQTFGHEQALDQSRKNMNIAKYILSEMMDQRDQLLAANSKKIHKVTA
jgi:hypothetical protein